MTEEQERAYAELLMGRSVLLVGAAGTGKSEFIRHVRFTLPGRIAVVAPTGMASMNVGTGAVTIHSLFQVPPVKDGYFDFDHFTLRKRTERALKNVDYLVIDEISMVRPDLFDLMESLARRARKRDDFFGGICLLLVGDFHQLPPIVRREEGEFFLTRYGSENPHFFDAKCLRGQTLSVVQLTKMFRQQSVEFWDILTKIGEGKIDRGIIEKLNSRVIGSDPPPKEALVVTPYRESAERKNREELEALPGAIHCYVGKKTGTFEAINGDDLPSPEVLELKEGASIIFTCNATGNEWVNGTGGKVIRLHKDSVDVMLRSQQNRILSVGVHEWSHLIPDSKEYATTGTYRQIPLRLGYALTVHKTQGKTCDSIVVQNDRRFFACGQLYVALSRARTLESIYLTAPLRPSDVKVDSRVVEFHEKLAGSSSKISL
ncbi:MAG: AAA family ATPase [Puniceicoccales bacterium]|nr:AAA family ATPase [Puniceicoccales bacterium]